MKRLLREPLLHFALLGTLLFALKPWWQTPQDTDTIVVSAGEQQRLRESWQRETGHAPSAEQMTALLNQHIDEELLLREARRQGLQLHDPVVRDRLLRNMRFAQSDTAMDDDALFNAALTMGMDETDLVVRRRLIELMRHRIESRVAVSEAEVRDHFRLEAETAAPAPRYSFEQIYFKSATAGEILAAQNALKLGRPAGKLGDPFLLGQSFEHVSATQIERQFGSDAAQLIAAATPEQWFGPVISAYGKHLIRVSRVEAATHADYGTLRAGIAARVYNEKEQKLLRSALDKLRSRYALQIEDSRS